MVILTDDQQTQIGQPTRANILRAMAWLVEGACPHDSLFFHYSGNGGQTVDEDGDHIDGPPHDGRTFSLIQVRAPSIHVTKVLIYLT
jgi:hypothetical protein